MVDKSLFDLSVPAEHCAYDVAKWLDKEEIFGDCIIYANEKKWQMDGDNLVVRDCENVRSYLEYAGDFMSLSFDGSALYEKLNFYYGCESFERADNALSSIFDKYGKYYELGHSWNLSLFDK